MNPRDVEIAFHGALIDAGLRPHGGAVIPGDGTLHRYRLPDDKPARQNGWAILHVDRVPHGEAGSWKSGAHLKWTPERVSVRAADRAKLERAQQQRVRERQAEDPEHRSAAARALWRATRPAPATIVDVYLDQHRGYRGVVPPTIRCAPALWHQPSGRVLPAMIAAVAVWPSREVVAVHRTWLNAETAGKAPVQPVKMMLGPVSGGAVRLAECGERLAIAEGIETGLIAQHATGIPTWAALSASGMECVVLPTLPLAREVFILADCDASGRGLAAAKILARDLVREGRTVHIAMPEQAGTDWADVLAAPAGARDAA